MDMRLKRFVSHQNQETSDAMIVVHGIGSNYHEVLNVAFNYLENGYNVVVYHQRNTGLTGGDKFHVWVV